MKQITEIGQEASQKLTLIGENGERITLNLSYKPSQQSWYFGIEYLSFSLHGMKLVNSPNILRQYANLVPFGISCLLVDKTDPYFIDDFTSGRAVINLLNESEVALVEDKIFS